jgi:hypothetical protein
MARNETMEIIEKCKALREKPTPSVDKDFHSDSTVYNSKTGEVRRLDSYTKEERDQLWNEHLGPAFAKAFNESVRNYVREHPEAYDQIREALLSCPSAVVILDRYSGPYKSP